jgi:hypothetical protein
MQTCTTRGVYLLALLVLAAGIPLKAQSTEAKKPSSYTYLSEWAVPRAQWGDMEKLDENDKPLLDKLVMDGILTSYGAYTNLIHQEGTPTHGTWFTAASEGNILKALEAIYAHPESIGSPVQAASHHWDYILVSDIYNRRSGKSAGGYLTGDEWYVKPGEMKEYQSLVKSTLVPVCEKLLADGVISSYGLDTEDYHQDKLGLVMFYMTTPDADSFDKAGKAFDDAFDNNPALAAAFRSLVEREGHRDFLDRVRFMSVK